MGRTQRLSTCLLAFLVGSSAVVLLAGAPPPQCPDDPVKWSQRPGDSWFLPSSIDWSDQEPNTVAADDFISDGRPITGVRFWGSNMPPEDPFGDIDGWLISFHADDGGDRPTELLGLYFCPVDKVSVQPAAVGSCFGTRTIQEYCVQLADCCPVHIDRPDPRDGSTPARRKFFAEVNQMRYWIDIQAVTGHTYDENCEIVTTGHETSEVFWAWHKGPGLTLSPPAFGQVEMDGEDWVYSWGLDFPAFCTQDGNMAFELLAGGPPKECRGPRVQLDFEDLPLGMVYNSGDTFVTGGAVVSVGDFAFSPGACTGGTTSGAAEVVSGGAACGAGKELGINNVTLEFDFGRRVEDMSLRYGEFGGTVSLEINGVCRVAQNFADFDGTTLGGVVISALDFGTPGQSCGWLRFAGDFNSFTIGGQELWIDEVCGCEVPNKCPERRAQADFEDLAPSTVYTAGESFLTDGAAVTVGEFHFAPGACTGGTTSGFAEVETGGLACGSGNELQVNNVTLDFDFGSAVENLGLLYGEYGGTVSLEINGDCRVVANFADLDGATLGGVVVSAVDFGAAGQSCGRLSFAGTVDSFVIGGQELWIDEVCACPRPKCPDVNQTDFEDLALGMTYNSGDSFVTDGATVSVTDFFFNLGVCGGATTSGFTEVENGGVACGAGNELQVNNVTLNFDYGTPVDNVSLRFRWLGGETSLEVNGDCLVVPNFDALDTVILGGVVVSVKGTPGLCQRLSLSGTVSSFGIGGQELWIDDVCTCPVPALCPDLSVKWSQPPGEASWLSPSSLDWLDMEPNIVTADDFISDGRPIAGVRFWGSNLPPGDPFADIDGWLVSFHAADESDAPTELLGLYFCPKERVTIRPTNIGSCFGSRVVHEYCVLLADCCPVHIERPDPRNGVAPAWADLFTEVEGFRYWLDIQAVTGHTYDPDSCELVITDKAADEVFWGWHRSPGLDLDPPAFGQVHMDGEDWAYSWDLDFPQFCEQDRNQAFELFVGEPPEPVFKRGDVTCDGCVTVYDASRLAEALFIGSTTFCCEDAADANDDGIVNITDTVEILNYIATGSPVPPAPGPTVCGPDPSADSLGCTSYPQQACKAVCRLRRPCDCNEDGLLDIADPVCLLNHLFVNLPPTLPCGPLGSLNLFDANADGAIDISDAVWKLNWMFVGTQTPLMCRDGSCIECILVPDCPELCTTP